MDTQTAPAEPVEQVVLLDEDGAVIGTHDKATVHHAQTPLHLAFSCYAFDDDGRLLVTQRASDKATFPGVWTNSFCGHPEPGESFESAIARRAWQELGVEVDDVRLVLPDFRYSAQMNGVVENEVCPVFLARFRGVVRPASVEVEDSQLLPWTTFAAAAASDPAYSPWAKLQVAELIESGGVADYLAEVPSD